jgi:phytoene dehydrogenase-like protein
VNTTIHCDVIVIGAGQNGLAAAVRLAKAGKRVLVLEARSQVGGLCAPIELAERFIVPGVLHDDGLVDPNVASALELEQYGLQWAEPPATYVPVLGERGLVLPHEPPDAAADASYREFVRTIQPLIERVMSTPPPSLSPRSPQELWEFALQGLGVWKLGRKTTLELLRVLPMCVADFLNERFQSQPLVEALAARAVLGTWAGPWSAGTTTNLLLREARSGKRIRGGAAALIAALQAAAKARGVELRTNSAVQSLVIEAGVVNGVSLASGETVRAKAVLASCDPKQTLLDLVPPATLALKVEEDFLRVRSRGTAAKLHLALSGPSEWSARPGQQFESISLGGGNVDDLERAFDAIKYRQFSSAPHLDIRISPSAPYVASILIGFVPRDLDGGWTDSSRNALLEAVLKRIDPHAPRLRSQIVAQQLLTPRDLEAEYRVHGGQLFHVEPALDQMLVMRPTASSARFATPLPGLWLGGSGSHGGGGVSITAGVLAAEFLLRT